MQFEELFETNWRVFLYLSLFLSVYVCFHRAQSYTFTR